MDKVMELHQIIYGLLASQIEFGTYRYKDPLPKMEEVSQWFSVSLDTVKAAYRQLKENGYIISVRKAGAFVAVRFQDEELERNIQKYFSLRKNAVMDLCHAFVPLFSYIQWYGLKNAGPEQLDELEHLCTRSNILRPYVLAQHIRLIYGSLNNDLLLRLIWQAYLFFQAPFFSLPSNLVAFEDSDNPLLNMIRHCRRNDWDGLWKTVAACQERIASATRWFYENRVTIDSPGEPVPFDWNIFQSPSQRCYSIAINLLKGFRLGIFTPEDFLPAPAEIAEHMKASAITVRRTLTMLNQLGVIQSINGVGTKVLNMEESMKNCDFTQPVIQRRMLDFVQSLQILAMTCEACAKIVIKDAHAVGEWKDRLAYIKENGRFESVIFASLEIIPLYSPNQVIREIYEKLLQLLLWGYPLRSMHGSRADINSYYLPHINSLQESLERSDWDSLAAELENLLIYELRFAAARLEELGIKGATSLIVR